MATAILDQFNHFWYLFMRQNRSSLRCRFSSKHLGRPRSGARHISAPKGPGKSVARTRGQRSPTISQPANLSRKYILAHISWRIVVAVIFLVEHGKSVNKFHHRRHHRQGFSTRGNNRKQPVDRPPWIRAPFHFVSRAVTRCHKHKGPFLTARGPA